MANIKETQGNDLNTKARPSIDETEQTTKRSTSVVPLRKARHTVRDRKSGSTEMIEEESLAVRRRTSGWGSSVRRSFTVKRKSSKRLLLGVKKFVNKFHFAALVVVVLKKWVRVSREHRWRRLRDELLHLMKGTTSETNQVVKHSIRLPRLDSEVDNKPSLYSANIVSSGKVLHVSAVEGGVDCLEIQLLHYKSGHSDKRICTQLDW
jgi:hypothetical protein